jgi:hypothetical protein
MPGEETALRQLRLGRTVLRDGSREAGIAGRLVEIEDAHGSSLLWSHWIVVPSEKSYAASARNE